MTLYTVAKEVGQTNTLDIIGSRFVHTLSVYKYPKRVFSVVSLELFECDDLRHAKNWWRDEVKVENKG